MTMRGKIASVAVTLASLSAAAVFAGTAQAAVVSPAATSADSTAAQQSIVGRWVGTYTCGQGLTGVTMDIYPEPDNKLDAEFEFYPVDSNSSIPDGLFTMTGGIYGPTVVLTPGKWVQQPQGYSMVGMHGHLPTAQNPEFAGDMDATLGCTTFATNRMDGTVPNSTVTVVPQ